MRSGCNAGSQTRGELSADQNAATGSLAGGGALTEFDSKTLVAAFGVQTTRDEVAQDADAAEAAAERIGYPVAVKVNSPDILHKTEARRDLAGSDGRRRGPGRV